MVNIVIVRSGRRSGKKKLKPFLESSYSYMPLVWGATLAFWLGPALQEGGHILPVSLLPHALHVPTSCPACACELLSAMLSGSQFVNGCWHTAWKCCFMHTTVGCMYCCDDAVRSSSAVCGHR